MHLSAVELSRCLHVERQHFALAQPMLLIAHAIFLQTTEIADAAYFYVVSHAGQTHEWLIPAASCSPPPRWTFPCNRRRKNLTVTTQQKRRDIDVCVCAMFGLCCQVLLHAFLNGSNDLRSTSTCSLRSHKRALWSWGCALSQ